MAPVCSPDSPRSTDSALNPLPDPALFPHPYPYPFRRPSHHLSSLPALSSPGSSSASTRSSAHTSSGSALAFADFSAHVHDPSSEDDPTLAVGITSHSLARILAHVPSPSLDPPRWSPDHPVHARSRSSSPGIPTPPMLTHKPSYDMSWHRDDLAPSEDETDDDHPLGDDPAQNDDENDDERTSAAVIAEEGRGLIVQADSTPIVQLHVHPGTTHLLIGSSVTPNSVPAFLTSTIPHICTTLLALDISANFLGALPPVLGVCENLEELNVASNPLRVLPVFLADLTSLRVLIADATGISTLPDALVDLDKLHTISVKRNKMHSLPSWLCLLPALQTLCVDGNPFQGPWKALVDPLLSKAPSTPAYPPSTPIFPPQQGIVPDSETDTTDIDDLSDHDASPNQNNFIQPAEDEDHTITPDRGPILGRSVTSPYPTNHATPPIPPPKGALTRTRTTPSRAYFDQTRAKNATSTVNNRTPLASKQQEDPGYFGDHELRKMKSAGDLRRGKSAVPVLPAPADTMPSRPQYQMSQSSSNLLSAGTEDEDKVSVGKRFASLGPSSMGVPARAPNMSRPQLTQSMWNSAAENERGSSSNRMSFNRTSSVASSLQKGATPDGRDGKRQRASREGKEKGSRWGFLKKMSMGKMKVDSPSPPHPSQARSPPVSRPQTSAGTSGPSSSTSSPIPDRFSKAPQVDLRFSTTGLEPFSLVTPSSPPQLTKEPSKDLLQVSNITIPPRSASLLAPPVSSPRPSKRRSFLPVDAPGALTLNIPIPEAAPDTIAISGDDAGARLSTPSPVIDSEQYIRREEERAREAYMRALRSVMAYLRDMNDLSLSQQANPLSMYGAVIDENPNARPRRPTVVDGSREVSLAMSASSTDSSGQLRSSESISALRSGSSSNTLSVATTDSNGSSSEERKFKNDKGKRAMVIKEIVLTERTYVKGLQELMEIYIKAASVPVNLLSGVGSGKDSVVPVPERKIVFGGVDALFSFHKDSFLPALEVAAAPLMKSSAEVGSIDVEGQLSSEVAKAVGEIFLKHAAFMRMYSSYINNFDSSVQRVKYWSSDKNTPPAAPISSISPASSTIQLAGLGLSMSAISAPGVVPEGSPSATGIPNLSTSQKKRIKSYLKRCRMNPRHTQLNLEGYLLLPVQRIPRYRLLLEELLRSTPPLYEYMEDPLERALTEISSLANNMNEGKRESESRRKLVQWQTRIRGRFPSPLVQPHRRLIMDGPLLLTRVVRKTVVSFEAINAQGDASTVQVDCLAPELTPRPLIGILCNDLLVLCRDPSEGQDPASFVDLWAVLRMQTLPQPASIVHGNALRLVDNKAILYFDAPSPSDALNWYRAINLHIPASKT
ncbi:hypothetical protein BDQ17DRAFT_1295109 [Cyathus striatus]|nr:hypothetical protein BDQ17DRAFT_1295109 [Cyathus striatus]